MNVNWIFRKCRKHQLNISLLAAFRLPEMERASLEDHLAKCAQCRGELEKLRALSRGLETWRSEHPEMTPDRGAQFRLRQALRASAPTNGAQQPEADSIGLARGIRRVLLGSLTGVWTLILFFNLDSPSIPTSHASSPRLSTKQLVMALKVSRDIPRLFEKPGKTSPLEPSQPPRTQRRENPRREVTLYS